MSNLQLTNSLSRQKEIFKPINPKKISLYACGPTVYDTPHVGNARSLVVFDVLYRVLKALYRSNVTYVRNITDVDDKIIEASHKNKMSIEEITKKVTNVFHENCISLNCLKPSIEPKATEHIKGMIEMTASLISKGFAYENKGHVYFSVNSFKDYGKLSNKKLDELKAGTRIEISDLKKNSVDFVLWKPSKNEDPGWESPWGRGRPGWHLECSVMSEKYLGSQFDIHGGGLDLIFPHHENEIAQSCVNNRTEKLANYWVHNGFVTFDKEKMSKSLGNISTITEAEKKYSGQVVRLALLSSHYKQPLDWSDELLKNQSKIIDKWYSIYTTDYSEKLPECFNDLLDDLNTPLYISKLHELFNQTQDGNKEKIKEFNKACRLVGLFHQTKTDRETFKKSKIKISEKLILSKIKEREKAKKSGNYDLADKIRNELGDEGIDIKDIKDKTIWNYK